jgi:hypothetical protein
VSDEDRRFELPEGLSREEERAILNALERYFLQESPKPNGWVLQGRVEAIGLGALQVRKLVHEPWTGAGAGFVRRGVPPLHGRGDQR